MNIFKKRKIGLALGGGGVRAVSAIGVIRRLEKAGVSVQCIAGTSMGAIIGAMYSFYQNADEVEKKVRAVLNTEEYRAMSAEFSKTMQTINGEVNGERKFKEKFLRHFTSKYLFNDFIKKQSLISEDLMNPVIDMLIPDADIEDLKVKYCAVCIDLIKGEEVVIDTGNLRQAVKGSIAIPGIIPPAVWRHMRLIDGGSVSMTPVAEARQLGSDYVIAIDLMTRNRYKDYYANGMEIIERSCAAAKRKLHALLLSKADLIISPAVKSIHWSSFKKLDYCINAGEVAAIDIHIRQ